MYICLAAFIDCSKKIGTYVSSIWICGSVPKLHIYTQGKTWEEFLKNLQEAVYLYREEEATHRFTH